jgi:hypothetical protein
MAGQVEQMELCHYHKKLSLLSDPSLMQTVSWGWADAMRPFLTWSPASGFLVHIVARYHS